MKLVVFDGNSIINRAYYGIRPLTTRKGLHTNGIYGFLNVLLKFKEDENPDLMCVAFDMRAKTFRHKEYELYKANRKGMPEDLAEQMPVLHELLSAMNVKILEKEGFEADDIIGTVSALCEKEEVECVIVSGDRDDLQLATDKTRVMLTVTKQGRPETVPYDAKAVFDALGVMPNQLIDVKALMGDSSDNVPGVAGIGEKTAYDLIKKFGSLENIYENIDSPDIKEGVRKKLIDGKEMAFKSRFLVTIVKDMPLDEGIEDFRISEYDNDRLYNILSELEFENHIKRLEVYPSVNIKEEEDEMTAEIIEDIFPPVSDKLFFILSEDRLLILSDGKIYNVSADCGKAIDLMADSSVLKYTHDIKKAALYYMNNGNGFAGLGFDTMLAAYVINSTGSGYTAQNISADYGSKTTDLSHFLLKLPEICKKMEEKLCSEGEKSLYFDIELPLSLVLADMEYIGFKVNKEGLLAFSEELTKQTEILTEEIYEDAGQEFNINSTKQLATVLFEKLGLPVIKKTKTGYSTDADVLARLRNEHPVIDKILKYRQYVKLNSTYAQGLYKTAGSDGRIHSSFNQTITQTGRISSTEPNLQNIPIRNSLGAEIRKLFIPEDDYIIVDGDYSQIELRVLSHIADDTVMQEAFLSGADIHTKTASEVFKLPETSITPLMRTRAKAVNFGIVYGIGDYSLSQDLKISRKEAKSYIDGYLDTYKGVRDYMKDIVEAAQQNGYVSTYFGRRRYIPEMSASNKNIHAFGERVAKNSPIQGTAADIIKIAMINVHNRLKGHKSRLILQVHDELIIETYKDEIEFVKTALRESMEGAVKMAVPLIADISEGPTWYDAK